MLIFLSIVATLLIVVWVVLFLAAQPEDWSKACQARIIDNHVSVKTLSAKYKNNAEKLSSYDGVTQRVMAFFLTEPVHKKIIKLNTEIEKLQNSKPSGSDILIMPGYVIQRKAEAIGKSGLHKTIYTKAFELYGKKHAHSKTSQLLSKMLSYPVFGIAVMLILGIILLGAENTNMGFGVIGIGSGLILVLVYGIYDELSDAVNKRRKSICRQFPNVISKLALLVTSGMIIDRAWKETAHSQDTELYAEMRKTSEELDNLVSPETAYAGFIIRCNTKETAKLASAIMQSRTKGNAEIGKLLKDMAREVWQERRHSAKRDAEKANSMLMIPTMLLFLAILVMLMVPIAMNFSGL